MLKGDYESLIIIFLIDQKQSWKSIMATTLFLYAQEQKRKDIRESETNSREGLTPTLTPWQTHQICWQF
jgi:hypothetical protein